MTRRASRRRAMYRRASLRRAVAVLVLSLLATATPGLGFDYEAADAASHRIVFPVAADSLDRVRWSDTWGAPRSGGRSHIGVDILGERMIPLVAAADSEVTWGRFSNSRGTIVRLRDAKGWEYQYIHLNNDRPGTDDGSASCEQALSAKLCASLDGTRIRSGTSVKAGEVIGYMGDSGNAEWTVPHLHFEIYRPSGSGVVAVNPTPYVDEALERIGEPPGGSEPLAASTGPDAAVEVLYRRLEGRGPTDAERAALRSKIVNKGLAKTVAETLGTDPAAAQVDRLYLAFFLRPPDTAGWDYWVDIRSDGHSLEDVAEWFAESEEYRKRYDQTTFDEFLDQLYVDVLGRPSDSKGKQYWIDRLEAGDVDRGTIVVSFTQGEEMRNKAQSRTELNLIHLLLGQERPSQSEIAKWQELRSSTSLDAALTAKLVG